MKLAANLSPVSILAKDTRVVKNHSKLLENVLPAARNPSILPAIQENDGSWSRGTPVLPFGKDTAPSWLQNILPLPRPALL